MSFNRIYLNILVADRILEPAIILCIYFLFYQALNMYVSLRNKASRTNLNNSDVMNSSADQSRVDSTSTKRFARKQAPHIQSSRINKTPRSSEGSIKTTFQTTTAQPYNKKPTRTVSNFIQNEQLFLKISQTPLKNKSYNPIPSTDRATQSSYPRCVNESESMNLIFQSPNKNRCQCEDLKSQLEIKSAEMMLLEDQNMRLKRQISSKQSEYLKMKTNTQRQHKKTVQSLKEQIQNLRKQILMKNQEIKNYKKSEASLNREMKGVKYDKSMLEKQLEDLYKRKLTKDLRDLMSYRQQSLQRQVDDLRQQIKKQKTEKQKQMEETLQQLTYQKTEKDGVFKKLEIHSHILNKKVVDIQQVLKYKQQQFGKCLNNMQQTNELLTMQLKKTRKENIKLQRINLLSKQNPRKQISNFSPESNTLSLSLSSVNSRF